MSKSSAKAFGRGFSYHAGAGIGEAVRSLTTMGATAAILIGIKYVTTRMNHAQLQKDLDNLLNKIK